LFLFELLDVARATRSLDALPDTVEALIAADIDRLAPRDRDLVRYASVLGATFDPELVAAAVEDELEVDVAAWSRLSDLIEPDPGGGRRFRYVLIRETAYECVADRRRRQLHAWLAKAIEARAGDRVDDEAASLALHFHEAQQWEKSWLYGKRAGERAMEIYANAEAAVLLERGIE